MKFKMILFLCIPFPMLAMATDPQPILSKTKVIHPVSWYAEQEALWAARTRANASDLDAWMNYYAASRYAGATSDELLKIVSAIEKTGAGSFQANVVKSLQLGYSQSGFDSMEKAYAQQPLNPSTYATLLLAHEVRGDFSGRRNFSEKVYASDVISSSLLNYSYNVLMSVEPGSVLITEGDNTSLPLFVLQDVFLVRTDVKILQLDLLASTDFRAALIKRHHLRLDENSLENTPQNIRQSLVMKLPDQNPELKFFYALTISQENVASIREQLYVVGLASALSNARMNNLSIIQKNIETKFLLDYISVDFNGESEFASGKVFNANYLVPMLMLHEHYLQQHEVDKADNLLLLIQRIATQSGKEQLVNNFLTGRKIQIPYFATSMDLKSVEGIFKKVKDNIYAQNSEVTNAQYNAFLSYLQDHQQEALFQKFTFNLSEYTEPALSFMKVYTANRVVNKKERYFTNYPAVNLPHEGAVAYCDWLTEQYNAQPERKYKKVKFRLPTVNEWQIAALGYQKVQSWNLDDNNIEVGIPKDDKTELTKDTRTIPVKGNDILYPWYRSFNFRNRVLNSRGCSLGNFKFPDSQKPCQPNNKMITADGFLMMSSVQAYFPNDIGLYDVVGNVAEMIDEKGKACGGSWNQTPEESTIRSVSTYDKPDPAVGFRVFMEVIEK